MAYTGKLAGRTFLKPTEVASLLNVSPKTVYFWHRMGMIEGVKIQKILRIYANSVERMAR